jgi:hypothetical protein
MKIYFYHIKFDNHPLVWDYTPDVDFAICTFYCKNNVAKLLDKKAVVARLREQNYDGITIDGHRITIRKVTSFAKQYPMSWLIEKEEVMKFRKDLFFKNNESVRVRKRSDNPPLLSRPSQDQPTFHKQRAASFSSRQNEANKEPPQLKRFIKTYGSIKLDRLINAENNPELWGRTNVYHSLGEKVFEDKSKSGFARTSYLKSLESLAQMNQDKQNNMLLPAKVEVLQSLGQVLVYLNPTYKKWWREKLNQWWAKKPSSRHLALGHLKLVYQYFQRAVDSAMDNNSYNKNPTEFDNMGNKFPGNDEWREVLNDEALHLRAKMMLTKFFVLIDKKYKVKFAFSKKGTNDALIELISFKRYLAEQGNNLKALIQQQLEETKKLIVQVGKIVLQSNRLNKEFNLIAENKVTIFCGFRSFNALITETLQEKIKSIGLFSPRLGEKTRDPKNKQVRKNSGVDAKNFLAGINIGEIVKTTVRILNSYFNNQLVEQYISPLDVKEDKNFYLYEEWAVALKDALLESKRLDRVFKNLGKQDDVQTTIADITKGFLEQKINNLENMNTLGSFRRKKVNRLESSVLSENEGGFDLGTSSLPTQVSHHF